MDHGAETGTRWEVSWEDADLECLGAAVDLGGAVDDAIASGRRDLDELADAAYYEKYPERKGKKIAAGDAAAAAEWRRLRDEVARPALEKARDAERAARPAVRAPAGEMFKSQAAYSVAPAAAAAAAAAPEEARVSPIAKTVLVVALGGLGVLAAGMVARSSTSGGQP